MTPEKQLEKDAEKFLNTIGATFRKFGNYNHGKYKNKKGCFDWLIAHRNKLIWVEWKIKPRKPTIDQLEFQRWIKENNGMAEICYSIEELSQILESI